MVFIVGNIDGKRVDGKGELLHWYYSVLGYGCGYPDMFTLKTYLNT